MARNRIGIGLLYRPARLHRLGGIVTLESILRLLKTLIIRALLFVLNLTLTVFVFHPQFVEISKTVSAVTYSFSRFGGQPASQSETERGLRKEEKERG